MRQCIMWSGCAYFPLDAGHQGRKTESASVSREHHPYTEAERAPPNINVREGQRPPTRVESTSAGSSRQEGRKRVREIRGKKRTTKRDVGASRSQSLRLCYGRPILGGSSYLVMKAMLMGAELPHLYYSAK